MAIGEASRTRLRPQAVQASQHALVRGAELVVVRPPDRVMRVLELVGLDEQLELVDSY